MSNFRVLIVGGGLGGLTLANCLQHAGIDYLLLEGRERIGLHVGAGLGLEANGSRILDQLGVLADLEAVVQPFTKFVYRDAHGNFRYSTDVPELVRARVGYGPFAHLRSVILDVLYDHLWDKGKLLTNKRVQTIQHSPDSVTITCQDGSEHLGHIVVGQDGINSVVRKEMWRLCDLEEPGKITKKVKESFAAEYYGLYGVSTTFEGADSNAAVLTMDKDQVFYTLPGGGGILFWCLVEKMDKKYHQPQVPRYNAEDAEQFAIKRLDKQVITGTANIKFRDFWDRRVPGLALIALEEGHLDNWTWGRIVCTGDSVHKVTPEAGQGANQAIESAAALTNSLARMLQQSSEKLPDLDTIKRSLASFEAKRQPFSKLAVEETSLNVRIFTYRTRLLGFMIDYVFPLLGDGLANKINERHIGAEMLECVPVPPRSISGTMLFNPTQGIGRHEPWGRRALWALPMLAIGFLGSWWPSRDVVERTTLGNTIERGIYNLSQGARMPSAEDFMSGEQLGLYDSAPLGLTYNRQLGMFLLAFAPVYLIWLMEANRRGNHLKPVTLILVFGLLAFSKGFSLWCNIWFFLHYVQSPMETFAALDQRLLNMKYARALSPTLLFGYLAPGLAMTLSRDPIVRHYLESAQPWFPVWISVVHRLFAAALPDTTMDDRLHNVKADLPSIRGACVVTGFASVAAVQYVRSTYGPDRWSPNYFLGSALYPRASSMLSTTDESLGIYAGAACWMALLFADLKKAGMIKESWTRLLLYAVASVALLGPGAMLVGAWAWREEVLASKRHFGAETGEGHGLANGISTHKITSASSD